MDFRFGFEVFLAVSDACLQNHCKDPRSVRNHFLYGGGGGGADVHGRLIGDAKLEPQLCYVLVEKRGLEGNNGSCHRFKEMIYRNRVCFMMTSGRLSRVVYF